MIIKKMIEGMKKSPKKLIPNFCKNEIVQSQLVPYTKLKCFFFQPCFVKSNVTSSTFTTFGDREKKNQI
jgi:hypothetical protein